MSKSRVSPSVFLETEGRILDISRYAHPCYLGTHGDEEQACGQIRNTTSLVGLAMIIPRTSKLAPSADDPSMQCMSQRSRLVDYYNLATVSLLIIGLITSRSSTSRSSENLVELSQGTLIFSETQLLTRNILHRSIVLRSSRTGISCSFAILLRTLIVTVGRAIHQRRDFRCLAR